MYRRALACCFGVLLLSVDVAQAQSRLSIRAASVQPVDGWQQMQAEHCQTGCVLWVAPTAALTESDIEQAEPEVRDDAYRLIKVVFTDAGAKKMRNLSAAQLNKLIALVVDEKVIWTPTVAGKLRAGAKNNILNGNTPQGLTEEEVQRIMGILRPGQVPFRINRIFRAEQPR